MTLDVRCSLGLAFVTTYERGAASMYCLLDNYSMEIPTPYHFYLNGMSSSDAVMIEGFRKFGIMGVLDRKAGDVLVNCILDCFGKALHSRDFGYLLCSLGFAFVFSSGDSRWEMILAWTPVEVI